MAQYNKKVKRQINESYRGIIYSDYSYEDLGLYRIAPFHIKLQRKGRLFWSTIDRRTLRENYYVSSKSRDETSLERLERNIFDIYNMYMNDMGELDERNAAMEVLEYEEQ